MVGTQLYPCTIRGVGVLTNQSIYYGLFSSAHCYSSNKVSIRSNNKVSIPFLNFWKGNCIGMSRDRLRSITVISCKSSSGRFSDESDYTGDESDYGNEEGCREEESEEINMEDDDADYVEAIILMSETISHYNMLMDGLKETKWPSSVPMHPVSIQPEDSITQVSSMGPAFLRRFQSPTIFLRISCDGDYVLPIIVGEYAVENLIDSFNEDHKSEECPNQFHLARNLVEHLGYEVKMVKITKRVGNTFFARIVLHKPGEMDTFSVDARPSDAINVAKRCRAPVYVNKQIVWADATRILYGLNPLRKKPAYDVTLDSAADGPDLLSEEINVVRKMNLAAQEERYNDAAMWRDKLMKLRKSK